MLYLLVPRGSISALSHREASELIEHLVELGARRVTAAQPEAAENSDPNAATQEQRNFIHFLFGRRGLDRFSGARPRLSEEIRRRGYGGGDPRPQARQRDHRGAEGHLPAAEER